MSKEYLRDTYKLKSNPFIEDSAKRIHLQMWTDREKQVEEWNRIINQSITAQKNYLIFIIGSYGRGKTLSLFKIEEIANKYNETFTIYMNFKSEERPKAALDFMFRLFRSIDFNIIKSRFSQEDILNALKNVDSKLDEPVRILTYILMENKAEAVRPKKIKRKQVTLDNKTIQDTPQDKSGEDLQKLAKVFLCGDIKPTMKQMEKLGILRKIESIDIAKEYLAAILQLLKILNYCTLVITVDEFEYLFSLIPKQQRAIYLALLRSLYDFPTGFNIKLDNYANMMFFIGISEAGWISLNEMKDQEEAIGGPTVPLLERLDATIILDNFDKKQTKDLIIKRLKYNRVEEKYEDEPLIPFSQDFVDLIYELTEGAPRDVLTLSGHVLDEGLVAKVNLLTREFAIKVLNEHGF